MSDLVRNHEARFSHNEAHMSRVVRKPVFCICEHKDADLLISAFVFATYIVQSLYFHIRNFKPLAILCGCAAQFMSDLVRNREARLSHNEAHMSCVVRKPFFFCICENKDADQLRGNREADQRLCFRYIYSTISLLPYTKFQAFSHLVWLYSPVYVGPGRKPRRPVFSQPGSYSVVPGCKIRSLISTSQYYIIRYDIFIDLPREETCFQHTL